jgi:amidophosphoribosyltransferase
MCGIVGITGTPGASEKVHQGLLVLQHRGQDSAGITSHDFKQAKFYTHKELGQVSQVFNPGHLAKLLGDVAIGHTRYSTIGEIKECDLQPMMVSYPYTVAMAHNGNLSNFAELKAQLVEAQHFFTSDNDLEVLLHLLTLNLSKSQEKDFFEKLCFAVGEIIKVAEGGYSVVATIGGEGLMAFRDRHGIRPLVYGVKRNADQSLSYCFASETSVLTFLDYQLLGEVGAGELILVKPDGTLHKRRVLEATHLPCMFEWIYFAGAESSMAGQSVYETRLRLGRELGEHIKHENFDGHIDVVVPVPDTSRASAIALSEVLDLPYREVLIKNRYVQRSFIQNGQDRRKLTVSLKFSVIREQVEGRNILLVDDSIVRGTTSHKIVQLLRDHGARNVYLASTCPPIIAPCYYGIDFPTGEELVAHNRSLPEIEKLLNVEKVFFNDIAALENALSKTEFCHSCLTGKYPYQVKKGSLHERNDARS